MPRYKTFRVVILLALATGIPRPTRAQGAQERAVRAVVDSFFAVVAREQWDSAAALIDLPRFEPYFKQQIKNARTMLPQPPLTVEDMMARDSTMPRAVAEWEVQRMKTRYDMPAFGDMSHEFAGVKTLQALFALTLPEAVARWLQAQDRRTQMRESLARAGCPLAVLGQFPVPERTVLATARADDSTAYVVHANGAYLGDASLFGMEQVMILHRSGARWRIEPRHDLLRPGNMGFAMPGCPK